MIMTDLEIRPLVAGETELYDSLPDADSGPADFGGFTRTYAAMAAAREYRPEWTYVALRDGLLVARAAWWGGPDDDVPCALDRLDFTEADAAVALLREASLRYEYCIRLRPGWRDQPAVRAAAQARIDVAERAGMRLLVERYQYVWTPAAGLPDRPTRLDYRPEPDDGVILDVLRRIAHDSLDAHDRKTIAESGVDAAAREGLDILRWFPSPREWWRLAYTAAGDLVGIAVPARNYADPVIGYIGVVPEQRGHGHGYDLLVETTHRLVAEGVDRIVAGTDVTNLPMAAAFDRAGYPVTQERVHLT
jgi:GNAT superfamily N-acetyltransferase